MMPVDPQQISDDTAVHWLLGALSAIAAAFTAVIAWNGKDAMERLKKVELEKANRDEITSRFDELAENQRQFMKRSDDMHAENRATLNGIYQAILNQRR